MLRWCGFWWVNGKRNSFDASSTTKLSMPLKMTSAGRLIQQLLHWSVLRHQEQQRRGRYPNTLTRAAHSRQVRHTSDDTAVLVLLRGFVLLKEKEGGQAQNFWDLCMRFLINWVLRDLGILRQKAFEALTGLNALTSYDIVSAFTSKSKWQPV